MDYVLEIVKMDITRLIIHVINVYINAKLVQLELIVSNVEVLIEILKIVLVLKDIMMINSRMIVNDVHVMNALLMITVSYVKIIFKFQNVLVIEYSMIIGV